MKCMFGCQIRINLISISISIPNKKYETKTTINKTINLNYKLVKTLVIPKGSWDI